MIKRCHYIIVIFLYVILPWTIAEENALHGEKSNFYLLKVKDPVTEVNSLESKAIPVWEAKLKLSHLHPSAIKYH